MKQENNHIFSDSRVKELLERLQTASLEILGENLKGLYVHGSLAFGCFRWEKSDIDVLLVTDTAPTQEEKEHLMKEILQINELCPPKGLELSLVLERCIRPFCYPTPFELHYSNAHKERCQENLAEYCAHMNGTDKDLAAHVTVVRQVGITLYGTPTEQMFGEVAKEDYLDSLYYDIEHAAEDILDDPVYFILNLCRILAYVREGAVLSKAEGADWMQKRRETYADWLSEDDLALIEEAKNCYQSGTSFSTENSALSKSSALSESSFYTEQDFQNWDTKNVNMQSINVPTTNFPIMNSPERNNRKEQLRTFAEQMIKEIKNT